MNIIIQYLFFSILLVGIGHYVWNMLLEKYTVKKVKHVEDIHSQKYKQMFAELEQNIKEGGTQKDNSYLADEDKINMIHELSTYMGTLSV